jgi:hypothetical protein
MLLRNKQTGEEFHTPSGIAKALIATGTVEEVKADLFPADLPEVKWSVSNGPTYGDYLYPPVIWWSAGGSNGHCASFKGTAHLSVKAYVPGMKPVTPPQHIVAEYLRLFAVWAAKSKKRKPAVNAEQVSASTPKNILLEQGVKLNAKGASWDGVVGGSPWRREVETR